MYVVFREVLEFSRLSSLNERNSHSKETYGSEKKAMATINGKQWQLATTGITNGKQRQPRQPVSMKFLHGRAP